MGLEFAVISELVNEINESEELELEKDCALRGLKYKKKSTLQPMAENKSLDDAVKNMIQRSKNVK